MEAQATFGVGSDAYARNRPRYPAELFAWIAGQCASRDVAWDCATGNGQAAVEIARLFRTVEATDVSRTQLEQAFTAPNVRYSVRPAEATGFDPGQFDLVTVAQALHWFDLDRFWREVRRVARPGAFFCAWGYHGFETDAELAAAFVDPLEEALEPFWAANNRLLWRGYLSDEIRFPFQRVSAPAFAIEVEWPAATVVDYLRTWSAYKRAMENEAARRRIETLEAEATRRFPDGRRFTLRMPLTVAAGVIG
jgi:SAM-dependent methyltransferase